MKHNMKKTLAAAMTAFALVGVGVLGTSADAAYELSPEVKTATPALLEASQMGVRTYVNPDAAMQAKPNKDAIVVMSFGTTFKD